MPTHGWMPVTVPGAPSAWAELSKRFGKLPLKDVLQPAIDYAEKGYPLTPILGKYWQVAYKKFKQILTDDEFQHWFETFAPDGRAPDIGEIWRSEGHASTLRAIGETDGESFYRGEIAEKIDAFSKNIMHSYQRKTSQITRRNGLTPSKFITADMMSGKSRRTGRDLSLFWA